MRPGLLDQHSTLQKQSRYPSDLVLLQSPNRQDSGGRSRRRRSVGGASSSTLGPEFPSQPHCSFDIHNLAVPSASVPQAKNSIYSATTSQGGSTSGSMPFAATSSGFRNVKEQGDQRLLSVKTSSDVYRQEPSTWPDWSRPEADITQGLADFFRDMSIKPVTDVLEESNHGPDNVPYEDETQRAKQAPSYPNFMMSFLTSSGSSIDQEKVSIDAKVTVQRSSPDEYTLHAPNAGHSFIMENLEQIRCARLRSARITTPMQQSFSQEASQDPFQGDAPHRATWTSSLHDMRPATARVSPIHNQSASPWDFPLSTYSQSNVTHSYQQQEKPYDQKTSPQPQMGGDADDGNAFSAFCSKVAFMPAAQKKNPDANKDVYDVRELLRLGSERLVAESSQEGGRLLLKLAPGNGAAGDKQQGRGQRFAAKRLSPTANKTSNVHGTWTNAAQSKSQNRYDPYVPLRDALTGLSNGKFLSGVLCVPSGNTDEAYIANTTSPGAPDFFVDGRRNRNRSVHQDTVVFEVLDESQWVPVKNPYDTSPVTSPSPTEANSVARHPSVRIVHVLDFGGKDRSYIAVLRSMRSSDGDGLVVTEDQRFVKAVPVDRRIPWILIPLQEASKWESVPGTLTADSLYRVQIVSWSETSALPCGRVISFVGHLGDFDASERLAMIDNELEDHMQPFHPDAEREALELVKTTADTFEQQAKTRVDFRGYRVFTIDPKTARDLDDAIHIRRDDSVSPPEYEVGVHIADVTHFVQQDSKIDEEAQKRCTTVYLPRQNFPMLPRALCDHLCSLNPNEDKLTFTALFYLTSEGTLSEKRPPRFVKSLIRSCARFNYEEVQAALDAARNANSDYDNDDERTHAMENVSHPEILGGHTWRDVWEDLVLLETLTQNLRRRRFESGSLLLHDFRMNVDFETLFDFSPMDTKVEMDPEGDPLFADSSHHLIEELMLTANALVAEHLLKSYLTDYAVVRRHRPPDPSKMEWLSAYCGELGLQSNFSSSASIHKFFTDLAMSHGLLVEAGVEQLFMKHMYAADYVVAGNDINISHFALNFPIYTHFTSPIRRYADVLVHRLLYASLLLPVDTLRQIQDDKLRQREIVRLLASHHIVLSTTSLEQQCQLCNKKRLQAKEASFKCAIVRPCVPQKQHSAVRLDQLFYCIWLKTNKVLQPELACALICQDISISVFVPQLGTCRRIYYNNCKEPKKSSQTQKHQEQETTILDKIPASLKGQIVIPLSIERLPNGIVKIIWIRDGETSLSGSAGCTSTDATKGEKKTVKQIIKPFTPVPVFVVPVENVPPDFATVLIPPWDARFTNVITTSPLLTPTERDAFARSHAENLQRGYIDVGKEIFPELQKVSGDNATPAVTTAGGSASATTHTASRSAKPRSGKAATAGARDAAKKEAQGGGEQCRVDVAAAARVIGFHSRRSAKHR